MSPTHQTHSEVGRDLRSSVGDQLDSLGWELVLQGEPDTAGVVIVRSLHQSLAGLQGPELGGGGRGDGEGGEEEQESKCHH